MLSPVAGGAGIVTTGALNSGSITSGFGAINVGSSAITTTGTITGGTLVGTTIRSTSLRETKVAVSQSGGTLTLDFAAANVFEFTPSQAITTLTINNIPASGQAYAAVLKITGSSYAITWGSAVKWAAATAPTLSASGVDVIVLLTVDGGTTFYGFTAGQNLS